VISPVCAVNFASIWLRHRKQPGKNCRQAAVSPPKNPCPQADLRFLLNKISYLKWNLRVAWHSHSNARIAVMGVAKRSLEAAFKGSSRDA
jgi:hypothetical protein